jgi:sarcosine oxidase, subunit beta
MARNRFVVAGAGVVGASIAYHLALRGADGIVLADTDAVASGATGKALGGVRQQFSSAPEVRLARESVGFFRSLGPELFEPVGYLFLATTEDGLDELERRREVQASLGVPVERVDAARVEGLMTDDVLGAVFCGEDGTADPVGVTRELVRQASELGVEVREETDALELDADVLVLATGASSAALSAKLGVELPVRPLVRQLVETAAIAGLARDLPLTIESESGFHFRRRGDALVLAMPESTPRWGDEQTVDETLVAEWLERIARRFPPAAGVPVARAWAGLYDMTPDGHPIVGMVSDGLYATCGFSGHGFMQAPAVGRIVADELLGQDPGFDLAPYRLERFAAGAVFPETAIL